MPVCQQHCLLLSHAMQMLIAAYARFRYDPLSKNFHAALETAPVDLTLPTLLLDTNTSLWAPTSLPQNSGSSAMTLSNEKCTPHDGIHDL